MRDAIDWSGLVYTYLTERVRRGEIQRLTVVTHRSMLLNFCGTVHGSAITRGHVEHWLEGRVGLSPATRRNNLSAVRSWCRWLQHRGVLRTDPTLGVKPPRLPRRQPRALAVGDLDCLWNVLPDERARAIVALMHLGLRCCEVSRLTTDSIAWTDRTVVVQGKGGHERLLPVPEWVLDTVELYYVATPPVSGGPVIRRQGAAFGSLQPQTVSKMLTAWLKDAGVKRRPWDRVGAHAIRHTVASAVVDETKDLRIAQGILGHALASTTAIYQRGARLDEMRLALEAIPHRLPA